MGKQCKEWQTLFSWAPISQQMVIAAMKLKKCLLLGRKAMSNLDSILKRQSHYVADKGLYSQSYGFSSSHVWMWELDNKESWTQKNLCFWTVVLEKILESPLNCKEINPVNPKGISILNIHWKDWCWSWNSNIFATWCEKLTHWKIPWCWERLMAGGEGDERGWDDWMASLTQGHEFEQGLGVGDGQRSLEYFSLWGCEELDTTEQLNWTELILYIRN